MHLYFTAGFYADGRLGEIFIKADKTGNLASGSLDATATMISLMNNGNRLVYEVARDGSANFFPAVVYPKKEK